MQISTDGFAAYPEAVDLAFGPYVRYGTIIKEYKNANMIYTPNEMVGTKRTGIRGIDGRNAAHDMHVARRAFERHPAAFMKRLNRLTLCFSKKLENLEAAFAHVRGVVQLLLADPQAGQERKAATDRRDDGGVGRTCLEFR